MTRTNDPLKAWAHRILDEVRVGIPHTDVEVNRALSALGEPLQ